MLLVFWWMKIENREVAILTRSWISSRGNFCNRERYNWPLLNIKTTETLAFTNGRHFTRSREIASCPSTKQSHLRKCSNEKLRTLTLVNDRTLRTTDFASTLSNVNNIKISDLLEFLVMLLFSSPCFHPKIISRMLQDYGKIHGGDYFLIT